MHKKKTLKVETKNLFKHVGEFTLLTIIFLKKLMLNFYFLEEYRAYGKMYSKVFK